MYVSHKRARTSYNARVTFSDIRVRIRQFVYKRTRNIRDSIARGILATHVSTTVPVQLDALFVSFLFANGISAHKYLDKHLVYNNTHR